MDRCGRASLAILWESLAKVVFSLKNQRLLAHPLADLMLWQSFLYLQPQPQKLKAKLSRKVNRLWRLERNLCINSRKVDVVVSFTAHSCSSSAFTWSDSLTAHTKKTQQIPHHQWPQVRLHFQSNYHQNPPGSKNLLLFTYDCDRKLTGTDL